MAYSKSYGSVVWSAETSYWQVFKEYFLEGELSEEVVVSKMEITTQHGAIEGKTQTQETQFYNLDAIISVGYRVNSAKATHFRIWATNVLKEYMIKGFVLDSKYSSPDGYELCHEQLA